MNQQANSLFKKLIWGIVFGFIVILALALLGDLRQVGEVIRQFNWLMFPVALLFTLFNYTLRFIKFYYYLHLIGAGQIGWKESLRIFIAGFPLAVTPGKVGEALKGVWIKQASQVPVGRGISTIIAERISDGLAVLLLSIFGVIVYPQYWLAFAVILSGLLGLIVAIQIRPLATWFLDLGARLPFARRFVGGLRDLYEGSYALFKPIPTLIGVGLGTISWFGEGIGFYLILTGLGQQADVKLFALAIFVLSFSTVVGAISALPGGLGAAEASIAGMLTLLGGISPAVAASATLLIRLATLWFGVLLGLCVWVFSLDLLGLKVEENGKTFEG